VQTDKKSSDGKMRLSKSGWSPAQLKGIIVIPPMDIH
jgi:hypothetical protein